MAGDWIKFRTELVDCTKVRRVARILGVPRATVLGGILILWAHADTHTTNGLLEGLTLADVDDTTGVPGLAAALADPVVDWARETDKGVQLPRWSEHNGKTAKRRAIEARRSARRRTQNDHDPTAPRPHDSVTESGRSSVLEQEQHRARTDAEKSFAAKQGPPAAPNASPESVSPPHAAAGMSAGSLCSLLLRAGIPGMRTQTAAAIAREAKGESHVAWAIERTREAIRDKSARNPLGYLRSLVRDEDPPPGWVEQYNRKKLGLAGAKLALAELKSEQAANSGRAS